MDREVAMVETTDRYICEAKTRGSNRVVSQD